MFKTIVMTFKLTWQNQRWPQHVYVCCISQGSIKTRFKEDWRFWCHFVPNLLGYMLTNKYSNMERFDKVIAKIKWCIFLPHSEHIGLTCNCAAQLANSERWMVWSKYITTRQKYPRWFRAYTRNTRGFIVQRVFTPINQLLCQYVLSAGR